MKLPPRTGTVTHLTGKRRNPWCAKRFIGWKDDDEKRTRSPIYEAIGYYPRKSDAVKALIVYTLDPHGNSRIPLETVYKEWSEKKFPKLSKNRQDQYRNAWRYFSALHHLPISSLRAKDFELAIEHAKTPRTVRSMTKELLSQLYKYAIAHDYCEKNYADFVDFNVDNTAQITRKVIPPEEVARCIASADVFDNMIAVGVYTGMRPAEVCELLVSEVDLPTRMFRIAGSKTESGKNRTVPIHPDILPLIERRYNAAATSCDEFVFPAQRGYRGAYGNYYYHLKKLGYTPHDTRHSFGSYAKMSGLDEHARKKIMGHVDDDLTNRIYTHVTEEWLTEQMTKLRIS